MDQSDNPLDSTTATARSRKHLSQSWEGLWLQTKNEKKKKEEYLSAGKHCCYKQTNKIKTKEYFSPEKHCCYKKKKKKTQKKQPTFSPGKHCCFQKINKNKQNKNKNKNKINKK